MENNENPHFVWGFKQKLRNVNLIHWHWRKRYYKKWVTAVCTILCIDMNSAVSACFYFFVAVALSMLLHFRFLNWTTKPRKFEASNKSTYVWILIFLSKVRRVVRRGSAKLCKILTKLSQSFQIVRDVDSHVQETWRYRRKFAPIMPTKVTRFDYFFFE